MSKKDDTTPTETNEDMLFLEAMQDVLPLTASDKIISKIKKPSPRPRQKNLHNPSSDNANSAETPILNISANDEWFFARPGVSKQTLRRLKRGYWPIQGRLDLHGLTQDEARKHLTAFVNNALLNQLRCVQIIHGKGLSSKDGVPVLKICVGNWLAGHSNVLAFCQAEPKKGGSGAVIVLLKATDT